MRVIKGDFKIGTLLYPTKRGLMCGYKVTNKVYKVLDISGSIVRIDTPLSDWGIDGNRSSADFIVLSIKDYLNKLT
jgi:hypothetical protein